MTSLVNPIDCSNRYRVGSSNLLSIPLDYFNLPFADPTSRGRQWIVRNAFAVDPSYVEMGLRLRVFDTRDELCSFINQRDLEVLLGLARPDHQIPWAPSQRFYAPGAHGFVGLYLDEVELEDDLFLRECVLRCITFRCQPTPIPKGTAITRALYDSQMQEYQEVLHCVGDCNPVSGWGPDPERASVKTRWKTVSTTK